MKNIIALLITALSVTGAQAIEPIETKEDEEEITEITQIQKKYTGLNM